jgi:ketosteroid isomerase-like protein
VSADDNIKTIQVLYEAFGRGDVAAILEGVTEDVDWASEALATAAPWHGAHKGKAGVAAFFQEFGGAMEVEEFTPTSYASNGDEVHTVVRYRGKVRSNGNSVAMNLHHYFVFDGSRVRYYRGTEDTAQTEAALRG